MCFVMFQRHIFVVLGALLAISEFLVGVVHGIPLNSEEFEDRGGKEAFKLFYFPWLRDDQSLRDTQVYSPDMVNRFQLLANRHKRNPMQKPINSGDITVNPDNKGDVGDSILPIHKDTSSALVGVDHGIDFIPRLVDSDSSEFFDSFKFDNHGGLQFPRSQKQIKTEDSNVLDLHNEVKTDVKDAKDSTYATDATDVTYATDEIEHGTSTSNANIMKIHQSKDRLVGHLGSVSKLHPVNENKNSPTLLEFFHKLLSLDSIPNRINKRTLGNPEETSNSIQMGKYNSTKKVIEGTVQKSKMTNKENSNKENSLDLGFLSDNDDMDSMIFKSFGGQDINDAGETGRNPLVRIMVEETFVDPKPAAWKLLDDEEEYGESLFNPILETLFGKPSGYIGNSANKYKINRIIAAPKVAKDVVSTSSVTESIVEQTLTTKCELHGDKCNCTATSGTKSETVTGLPHDNTARTGDIVKRAAMAQTSLHYGANTDALDKKNTVKNDSPNTEKLQTSTELNIPTKDDSKQINEKVNLNAEEKEVKDKKVEVGKHETSKQDVKSVADMKEKSEQKADGFFSILRTLFGRKR